jgi:hypothetical protein
MTTCDKVRSNGEVCGKPCADGQKKNRCAKHKGLDPVKVDPDANPYTPNSREWLDFNKKLKKKAKVEEKKSGGGAGGPDEINPYSVPHKDIYNGYDPDEYFEDYTPVINLEGNYLLKGTPIKHLGVYDYIVKETKLIELPKEKSYVKKWGDVEVKCVKDEKDIEGKECVKFFVNELLIKKKNVFDGVYTEHMTYKKFLVSKGRNVEICKVDDTHITTVIGMEIPREDWLWSAGQGLTIDLKYADTDSENIIRSSVELFHLKDEELKALVDKKIKMREKHGDDTLYKDFVLKKYGKKKISEDSICKMHRLQHEADEGLSNSVLFDKIECL